LERYLKKCEGKFPSLVEAAEHFSMSPRMFRRTLEASGSNYRAMVEETKSHLARQLLVETSLDVAIIAERLGYKDTGNFSRAFRQWTGFPPGKYRSLPNSKKNLNDQ
ncbi:MAG: helix-turn-helix transcriptional regulator, partial [Oleibacter sp.]|nr:helix-turn-helix transcriptional regulator [Thalassolituus sp.]